MKFLKVFQIYYDQSQEAGLEKDYIPFNNQDCSIYFESDVIIKLIQEGQHEGCEYFGVVSHKLREKTGVIMRHRWKSLPNIANHSSNKFEPNVFEQVLLKSRPDAMSFQRHPPHDPITFADKFHPGFSEFFAQIMFQIGFPWHSQVFKNVFYCNYFVAAAPIYAQFVNEMLIPARAVMERMPDLWYDSRYPQKLPTHLAEKWGITHYPFHPFLCERMFSYFVHLKQYKCLHF